MTNLFKNTDRKENTSQTSRNQVVISQNFKEENCMRYLGESGCWWGDYVALFLCAQVWRDHESTIADGQRLCLVSILLYRVDKVDEQRGAAPGLYGLTERVEGNTVLLSMSWFKKLLCTIILDCHGSLSTAPSLVFNWFWCQEEQTFDIIRDYAVFMESK